MTFMEAVAAMREGKYVKRHGWYNCFAIHRNNEGQRIEYPDGDAMVFEMPDFEATDWEVVE